MRKFFALALAVAMVMSLAAVSFAADDSVNEIANIELVGPFRYDADKNYMIAPGENGDMMRYGSGVYYLIQIDDADIETELAPAKLSAISAYKEVEKLKAKAEFEIGEELVDSISIVKKYVDATDFTNGGGTDAYDNAADTLTYSIGKSLPGYAANTSLPEMGFYYFVELMITSKEATAEADVIATIEFDRKADDDVVTLYDKKNTTGEKGIGKIKDDKCEVEFTVFYKDSYVADGDKYTFDGGSDNAKFLKYDTNYALKFNCDEEVELEFGDGDNDGTNEGTFTVDVSGQGKVFLKYNTKANEAISAANPGVKMHFVNFNNVKFNRVGEFVYAMDDMVAAYKVVGDQLVEIKGAEFDTDEVAFNTRVLESYVFADAELVNPAAAVEAPVVEAPAAVTNPSTGA